MKKLGMNFANTQEVCSWHNRREDECDFSHLVALLSRTDRRHALTSDSPTAKRHRDTPKGSFRNCSGLRGGGRIIMPAWSAIGVFPVWCCCTF